MTPQNVLLRHANLKNDILTGTITAQKRTSHCICQYHQWKYELLASHRYKCQQLLDIVCDSESSFSYFYLEKQYG